MKRPAFWSGDRIGSLCQERYLLDTGIEPRLEPAASFLRDPWEVHGEQCIDASVTAVALHIGATARYQTDEELALLRGYVQRPSGITVARIAEHIASASQQLLITDDVDDGVRDVELSGSIAIEIVHSVSRNEADVPMPNELSLTIEREQGAGRDRVKRIR
jgi:hypothetical protein